MKKQPEDLKIQKPLSLHPMKFDDAVDVLLATKPKRNINYKKQNKDDSVNEQK